VLYNGSLRVVNLFLREIEHSIQTSCLDDLLLLGILFNTLCYQVVSFTITRGGFGGLEINPMQRFPHGPNSGEYEFAHCQTQVLKNLVTRSRTTKPATLTDKCICKHVQFPSCENSLWLEVSRLQR
jgi:hypothetical protein